MGLVMLDRGPAAFLLPLAKSSPALLAIVFASNGRGG